MLSYFAVKTSFQGKLKLKRLFLPFRNPKQNVRANNVLGVAFPCHWLSFKTLFETGNPTLGHKAGFCLFLPLLPILFVGFCNQASAQFTKPYLVPSTNLVNFWSFSGNTTDDVGSNNLTGVGSPSLATDRYGNVNSAYAFDGSTQYMYSSSFSNTISSFSVVVWFKTNTTNGGKIIGMGSNQTGYSSNYDRHLYMNNNGQLYFGVYTGNTIMASSAASYNDSNWHMAAVVFNLATDSIGLSVDGGAFVKNGFLGNIQTYYAGGPFWRIGYDNLGGWPSQPSSFFFNGTIDDIATYNSSLSAAQVSAIYSGNLLASPNTPICTGRTLSFNNNVKGYSTTTYSWSGPNSFSSTSASPNITGIGTAGAGTYTLVTTQGAITQTQNYAVGVVQSITLSSTLTPAAICSGSTFSYTPTTATAGVTFTWTRAAVAGISNAAITTPQSSNPNEILVNTTALPITVQYAFTDASSGCSPQIVSVVVNAAYSCRPYLVPTTNLATWWPFSGNTNDAYGSNSLVTVGSPTLVTDRFGNSNGAYQFNGSSQAMYSAGAIANTVTSYSAIVWFKTTTSSGGRILGLGSSQTGTSYNYDRHLYMTNTGNLVFGVYTYTTKTVTTTNTYNDGNWHMAAMVYNQTADSLNLSIDGGAFQGIGSVGTIGTYGAGPYWRVGFDNVNGWPNSPGSNYFSGTIDDIATYTTSLSLSQIRNIFFGSLTASANTQVCKGRPLVFNNPVAGYPATTFAWTGPNSYSSSLAGPTITNFQPANAGTYILNTTQGSLSTTQQFSVAVKVIPSLTSSLNTTTICSGSLFSYTPTMDSLYVVPTWTRAAVTGISNAAITTAQTGNVSEVLVNTTLNPVTVIYSFSYAGAANSCDPQTISVIVRPTFTCSPYLVPGSGLTNFWSFSGNLNDDVGSNTLTAVSAPSLTSDRYGNANSAFSFNGNSQYMYSGAIGNTISTFSFLVWFKSTSTQGGKIIGLGDAQTGYSGSYDRHLYMGADGKLYYGVWTGSSQTAITSASFNDGNWHLAAVVYDNAAKTINVSVDASSFTTTGSINTIQQYSNTYWRIGFDNLNGWPAAPPSFYFNGSIDDIAVYSTALSLAQIQGIYNGSLMATSNSPVCTTSPLVFSNNVKAYANTTFSWTGPGSFTSNAAAPTVTSPVASNPGTYTLTTTQVGGISSIQNISATVYQFPTINSSLSNSICSGNGFNYSASSNSSTATLTWTRAAVSGISNAAITTSQSLNPSEVLVNTTTLPVNVVYAYTLTNPLAGCSNTQNVTVTVNPAISTLPTLSAPDGSSACLGNTISVSNAGTCSGCTYLWNNGSTGSTTTIAAGTNSYYVTATNAYGCTTIGTPVSVTSLAFGTWLGNSANWSDASNWCGGIPTATRDVTIGNSVANLPTIDVNASAKNISIPTGQSLNVNSGKTLSLYGNLTGGGAISGVCGSTLQLLGSSGQTLGKTSIGTLVVNNPNHITLSDNLNICNGLTLTSGNIIGGSNTITLQSTASSPTEISNSQIIGTVQARGRTVGTGSLSMLGVTIAPGADNLDTVYVSRVNSEASYQSYTSIGYTWVVQAKNQPVLGRTVGFNWLSSLTNGKLLSQMQVWRIPQANGTWVKTGTIQNISNMASNPTIYITTTDFSTWTVSDAANPLPLTWLDFTASKDGNMALLKWETINELGNKGFVIERSTDSDSKFDSVGFVSSVGNTDRKTAYTFSEPFHENAYYRLKQQDLDGEWLYSDVVYLGSGREDKVFVYPNPANKSVQIIGISGKGWLEIRNLEGKLLLGSQVEALENVDVENLTEGVYIYKVITEGNVLTGKLVKK